MAVAKTIAIAAAAVLAQYSEDEAVHVCEDGQCFRSRNLAELHSKAEKMAAPITVTRGEVSDELDAIAGKKNGKAKDAGKDNGEDTGKGEAGNTAKDKKGKEDKK